MDWTIVATTAISAGAGLGGAALGYWGAARQGQSEIDRQREQHREDERRHRQSVYHELIGSLRVLRYAAMGDSDPMRGGDPMTDEQFRAWRTNFLHLTDGAKLFGSTAVASTVDQVLAAYVAVELGLQFIAKAPEDTFASRLALAWSGPPGDAMLSASRDLIIAMRGDVATADSRDASM